MPLRVGRSQLRFLRSSVFPSFRHFMILMTNRIPGVRAREVILPVAPQPPGHTNWPDCAFCAFAVNGVPLSG